MNRSFPNHQIFFFISESSICREGRGAHPLPSLPLSLPDPHHTHHRRENGSSKFHHSQETFLRTTTDCCRTEKTIIIIIITRGEESSASPPPGSTHTADHHPFQQQQLESQVHFLIFPSFHSLHSFHPFHPCQQYFPATESRLRLQSLLLLRLLRETGAAGWEETRRRCRRWRRRIWSGRWDRDTDVSSVSQYRSRIRSITESFHVYEVWECPPGIRDRE